MPTSRKRLEAEELYQQAKESYKKREFVKAKELFEKVNTVVRDYQATEKFLARIDSDIQQEARYQQDLRRRDAQRQAKETRDQQDLRRRDARQAKETRDQQDLQRREAQRQAREKALEQKRAAAKAAVVRRRQETRELKETAARIKNDRDKMVTDKIQGLYREAESDYKNGLYTLARDRFNEVQRIAPGYRSTEEYLGNIAHAYGGEVTVAPIPVPRAWSRKCCRFRFRWARRRSSSLPGKLQRLRWRNLMERPLRTMTRAFFYLSEKNTFAPVRNSIMLLSWIPAINQRLNI